jgi:Tfp pilus assembly protein PilV
MVRLFARQAPGIPVNPTAESKRPNRCNRSSGGASLVEAMVALAVMAFGMLALVGVQATLRMNNDLAKQRSEATIIATEEVERLRNYFTLLPAATPDGSSWTEIAGRTVEAYTPVGAIGNTSYRVERTVNTDAATRQKVFTVDVSWADRTGVTQRVVLDGMVWGVVPELSPLLAIPTRPSAINQINGRDVTIPAGVVDVDGGLSRFNPPGNTTEAWMFDRATGALRVCDLDGTSNCRLARFISGEVRFHRPSAPGAITAADAETPQGPSWNLAAGPSAMSMVLPINLVGVTQACYADAYSAAQLLPAAIPRVTAIKYYCAVYSVAPLGWGGQLNPSLVDPANGNAAVSIGVLSTQAKVCRYTTAANEYAANEDHPKTYCIVASTTLADSLSCNRTRVNGNLINQNFLVIPGDRDCPSDSAINLAAGDMLNTNTLQHQP